MAKYKAADQWKDFVSIKELTIRDLIEKYLKESTVKISDITRMIEEYLNR